MQAIGQFCIEKPYGVPGGVCLSERFTNEMINAIRFNRTQQFRIPTAMLMYYSLMTSIFSLEREHPGRILHTFNALHELSRQIVSPGDRRRERIPTLTRSLALPFRMGVNHRHSGPGSGDPHWPSCVKRPPSKAGCSPMTYWSISPARSIRISRVGRRVEPGLLPLLRFKTGRSL